MVKVGKFSGSIMVSGVPLKEYYASDNPKPIAPQNEADAFVEVSYETDVSFERETSDYDPYGEPCTNNFYVTPWTISVLNGSSVEVGVRCSVDGQKIHESLLSAGAGTVIEGVQSSPGHYTCSVSQLLFARPRLPKPPAPDAYGNYPPKAVLTSEQVKNLCLMKIDFFEVKRWDEVVTPTAASLSAEHHRNSKAAGDLKPIDKEMGKWT